MSQFDAITSDEHFGHARIIELANRPFESVTQMNREIIARFNSKVPANPNFLTVHVGDMFWHTMMVYEALEILRQLHGSHAFHFGNHDELMAKSPFLAEQFKYVVGENRAGGAKIYRINDKDLTVDHFAKRVWQGSHRGHWHVFGHSHDGLPGLGKSFDIGVDAHDFFPWLRAEIVEKMGTLKQHHYISNTGSDVVDESRGSSTVEQPTCNRQVAGSSPVPGSRFDR